MKFIFIHVQRTAGTSILHTLIEAYSPDKILHDRSFRSGRYRGMFVGVSQCDREIRSFDKEKIDIIFGHFTIKKYWHMDLPFITFLRHPVERVISGYSVWRRIKGNTGTSIVEYARLSSNLMVKVTGGNLSDFLFVGIAERYKESILKLGTILGTDLPTNIKVNITKRKYPKYVASEQDRKEIEIYNKMDIELYLEAWNKL